MKYDWKQAGEEWSQPWGSSAAQWAGTIFPRIRDCLPVGTILEIAPGFGLLAKTVVPTSEEDVPPADAPVLNTFSPSLANTDAFEKLGGTGKHKIAKPDAGVEPTVTGAAAPDVATGTTGTSATSAQEKPAPSGTPILGWILLVWMIGAFAVLATFIAGHLVLRLMLQGARPVRDVVRHHTGGPGISLEYASAADPITLTELHAPADSAVISLAARVGKARLIDNVLLGIDLADLR